MVSAGRIHSKADAMKDAYDKVYQAECAKMGIITTADYAGISRTGIITSGNSLQNSDITYVQTNSQIIFTPEKNNHMLEGTLEIFSPQGKLLQRFQTNRTGKNIIWDRTNNHGTKIASRSVVIVTYATPVKTSRFKMVMR